MKRFSGVFSRQAGALFFRQLPVATIPLQRQQQQQQRFLSTTTTSGENAVPGVGGDVQDTEETHPDFQPRLVNTEFAEDEIAMVKNDINDTIKSEDVVVFIKGVPEAPMCAFSKRMIDMLELLGLEYTSFDVLAHPVVRTYVKEVSEWPTIPQLFMKGEFVGGLDVLQKMLESGDLQKLLEQKGITFRKP
ncbi:glutaredoxin-like protein [Trypanosoma theileri]|uniref:Glutaredoxin-like protein n=1 Tax=Trypanosoma theileri TaxID=67003 RepID=A0A1X0P310_9TRYP|nr:glutaredoxin-like protein [Trypanosoma theileri]ORC91241.1 glutaredoxin-like protein [Trypanosoma theileri]